VTRDSSPLQCQKVKGQLAEGGGKAKFLKRVNNSNNILCQTFAVEAAKEMATL